MATEKSLKFIFEECKRFEKTADKICQYMEDNFSNFIMTKDLYYKSKFLFNFNNYIRTSMYSGVVSIKTYEVGYGTVSSNFLLEDYAIMNSNNSIIPEVMDRLLEEEYQLNKIKHDRNKDN